ncbi:hypothetical protein [Rhodococcus sp. 05-2255-1e]|uniref:hypothetical protein n=1 Tax=Rhodococcus sp. 05-2255-1e TaxID=2022495 RepID=UPI00117AFF4D|nr:hypothetical protein [Rhodococcus sp. 05-2255-1e]
MITVVELRAFVGNPKDIGDTAVTDETLDRILATAVSLIDTWLGTRKVKVPADVYDTVLLGVAQQLYYRDTKDTSSAGQYGPSGDFVTTIVRDPMHYAYPILRKYVGWF